MLLAVANLTTAIERFVLVAEDLYPHLRRRLVPPANQSGGPLARIQAAKLPPAVD